MDSNENLPYSSKIPDSGEFQAGSGSEQHQMFVAYNSLTPIEQELIVNVTREYPFDYATVMFGYIMPFVLIITLFTNTLVVMVLAQRHMRTPTNIVLFTMAIVDLMTLLSPSPWYFYIYTLGYHDRFLHPPSACYAHHIMTDVIPVFFHTSSIWLALLLASQRYIYVCHPTLASTWCTVPRVRKAIFVILLVALLHQTSRFFDNTYESITIQYEQHTHLACKNEISQWVQHLDIGLYFSTYYAFRILFVFIIPCVALITLNCLLFRALRKAKNKRTVLMMKECNYNSSANSGVNNLRPSLRSCDYTAGQISQCRTETTLLCNNNSTKCGKQYGKERLRGGGGWGKEDNRDLERDLNDSRSGSLLEKTTLKRLGNSLMGSASANDVSLDHSNDDINSSFKRRNNNKVKKQQRASFIETSAGNSLTADGSSTFNDDSRTIQEVGSNFNQLLAPPATISNQNQQINTTPVVATTTNTIQNQIQNQNQTATSPTQTSSTQQVASLRSLDSNRTTLMLIVVVTVFLMVEVPVAVVTIAHVVLNSFDMFKDVEYGSLNYIKLFTNFIIMISYSVNFTIYCSMSKKFRETFKDLFLFGERARKRKAQQQQQLHQQQHQTTRGEQETGISGRARNGQPMIIFM